MKPKTSKRVERKRSRALERILVHDLVHDLAIARDGAFAHGLLLDSILVLARALDEAKRISSKPPPTNKTP